MFQHVGIKTIIIYYYFVLNLNIFKMYKNKTQKF